ncbi:hypothetical protein MCEMIHM21_00539 [Candidatus Pelagibacterales bacterium]|jgi:hypothetical protein
MELFIIIVLAIILAPVIGGLVGGILGSTAYGIGLLFNFLIGLAFLALILSLFLIVGEFILKYYYIIIPSTIIIVFIWYYREVIEFKLKRIFKNLIK